jgi:SH3 domain protein
MKQSIRRLLITGFVILFLATMGHAQTRYVTDKMHITFRTGPGNDRKIISLLNSDQQVEIIQSEGEWAKVRLPNGKEGWVLQQYLLAEVPCRIRIQDVSSSLEALKKELKDVQTAYQQLDAEKTSLEKDLKDSRQDLTKTKQSYEKLKKDAAGFLELKTRHDKTVERLSLQTQKANTLEKDLNRILKKKYIWWFLGGSGVLLLGFILGFSSKKQKRHSSLL